MEFHKKPQELRKQKNLAQEELSDILFVSRTAISKWESGHGYPSIDSLEAITEKDNHQKTQHMRDLVFGLIDCSVGMLFFIPLVAFLHLFCCLSRGALLQNAHNTKCINDVWKKTQRQKGCMSI